MRIGTEGDGSGFTFLRLVAPSRGAGAVASPRRGGGCEVGAMVRPRGRVWWIVVRPHARIASVQTAIGRAVSHDKMTLPRCGAKRGRTQAVPSTRRDSPKRNVARAPSPNGLRPVGPKGRKWKRTKGGDQAGIRPVSVAARPIFSGVVWPVARRHTSMASRRATATIMRLRPRPPFAAKSFWSGGY